MRLISAHIENYRLHRSATVTFADGLTLIVAANESGKSTLVEALHRALFLPHRTGGKHLAAMQSQDGGHPCVTLRFAADGATWTLRKAFRGQQGTCLLTCGNPIGQWSGDPAETRLAELLAGDDPEAKPLERWDHLWVMQGDAHRDPLATTGVTELRAALARGEGGVATLAPDDLELIATLGREHEATYSARGIRVDSELGRLQAQARAAQGALDTATAMRAERQHTIDELKAQQAAVRRLEPEVTERRATLIALGKQLDAARQEAQRLDPARDRAAGAKAKVAEHDASLLQLAARRIAVATLAGEDTLKDQRRILGDRLARTVQDEASLTADVERAQGGQQQLSDQAALAEAIRGEQRSLADLTRLTALNEKRAALATRLAERRAALAALVPIAKKELKRLQGLDAKLRESRAALATVSASISWQSGPGSVTVGGKPLALGEFRQIDAATELDVAGNRLVIRPGGGEDVEALRNEVAAKGSELAAGLAALGADSLDSAAALYEDRDLVERSAKEASDQYDALEDPTPLIEAQHTELARVQRQVAAAEAAGIAVPPEATAETLRLQADAARRGAKTLADQLVQVREHLQQTRLDVLAADESLTKHAKELERARTLFDADEARLGGEAVRAQRVTDLARDLADAKSSLTAIEAALGDRDPAVLEGQHKLLQRSLKQLEDGLAGAAATTSLLARQIDAGTGTDLDAAVDEAEARRTRLAREVAEATVRAEGVGLLYRTLCALRDEAREHNEAPFLAAVARYLDTVFRGTRVGLDGDGDERVLGLIDRQHTGFGSFTFEVLSRGTQELLAAAVRLAMAETIAARRVDGCLPVVFDDAFANLDPERLARLGLLLDAARSRGLQVIVLSCNDRDCGALGEDALVRLQRPMAAAAMAPMATVEAPRIPAILALAAGAGGGSAMSAAITVAAVTLDATDEDDHALLLAQVPEGGDHTSTRAVRDALGWDLARFIFVRDALIQRGAIVQPAGTRSLRRPN